MGMWVSRDEAADHSTPEGSRTMLRDTGATWLRGGHGGERNPTLTQYHKLRQVLSQLTSVTTHLLCGRSLAGLSTRTISNDKALLYTKSWRGACLCSCSFIKHLLHAGPKLHFEFLVGR